MVAVRLLIALAILNFIFLLSEAALNVLGQVLPALGFSPFH